MPDIENIRINGDKNVTDVRQGNGSGCEATGKKSHSTRKNAGK